MLALADFDYELPPGLIAERPAEPRESARLLVIGGQLEDRQVADIPEYLQAGDLLICNDTRVIPARLSALRGESKVEINLNREIGNGIWEVFAKPAKRLKPGDVISFPGSVLTAEVIAKDDIDVHLRFNLAGGSFFTELQKVGQTPLPPYIARSKNPDEKDRHDYQTVFARNEGAVAAPTAGLHFTAALMEKVKEKGVEVEFVTLHVGGGTFLPVKTENITEHKMHKEWCALSENVAHKINQTKASGGRVIAVGTTALRTLETAAKDDGVVEAFRGDTGIFIYPGYRFKVPDMLITNFHLPKSTLLMLVSAFAGTERIRSAYAHAVSKGYRFFSYGDCCLIYKSES